MTDFSIIKRPPKERKRLFQPDNLELMVCKIGSQNASLRGLPPIDRPKYTKGIFSTLQLRIEAASTNIESAMFTPINMLLWKFTVKPDIATINASTTELLIFRV